MARRLSSKLMPLLLALMFVSCSSSAQDAARQKEVNRIWTEFPVYAGMVQVNHSTMSGDGKALVSKTFRSESSHDDVKRFYLDRLSQAGWQFAGETPLKDWGHDLGGRELEFHRGDYVVTIQYAGEKADYGWDYAIGIGWH